jgi:20S proteasome alpha/beta subunit
MTVCIGALCNNGETVIIASDRMVTGNYPPVEFEHTKQKTYQITKQCVMLTAGDALKPIEIILPIKGALFNQKKTTIEFITEKTKELYQKLRAEMAENLYLKPRTITKEVFYNRGIGLFPPDLFRIIDSQFTNYNLRLDLIIAGIDDQGAHVYSVIHPGVKNCYDTIGFHAIGIGQLHSIQTFIAHQYTNSYNLVEALNIVYAAKKAAEVAPGVGNETDISIIDSKFGIVKLTDNIVKELSKIYEEVKVPIKKDLEDKRKKLHKLLSDETKVNNDVTNNVKKEHDVTDTNKEKK